MCPCLTMYIYQLKDNSVIKIQNVWNSINNVTVFLNEWVYSHKLTARLKGAHTLIYNI